MGQVTALNKEVTMANSAKVKDRVWIKESADNPSFEVFQQACYRGILLTVSTSCGMMMLAVTNITRRSSQPPQTFNFSGRLFDLKRKHQMLIHGFYNADSRTGWFAQAR